MTRTPTTLSHFFFFFFVIGTQKTANQEPQQSSSASLYMCVQICDLSILENSSIVLLYFRRLVPPPLNKYSLL